MEYPMASASCSGVNVAGPQHPPPEADEPPQQPFEGPSPGDDHDPLCAIFEYPSRTSCRTGSSRAASLGLDEADCAEAGASVQQSGPQQGLGRVVLMDSSWLIVLFRSRRNAARRDGPRRMRDSGCCREGRAGRPCVWPTCLRTAAANHRSFAVHRAMEPRGETRAASRGRRARRRSSPSSSMCDSRGLRRPPPSRSRGARAPTFGGAVEPRTCRCSRPCAPATNLPPAYRGGTCPRHEGPPGACGQPLAWQQPPGRFAAASTGQHCSTASARSRSARHSRPYFTPYQTVLPSFRHTRMSARSSV